MTRTLHLSATAIREFLHCPNCFRYGYIEGIRPVEDTESQRMGTNWHKLHELYRNLLVTVAADQAFDMVMATLGELYARVPDGFDAEVWETEYQILANSFAAYVWYYQNDQIETLATEVGFKLPLRHPKTNLPLPISEVLVPGKIDQIIRREGRIAISDYKSTTKSLDADSEFWSKLRLDSQLSTYCLALWDLMAAGKLAEYGITPEDVISGAFYDVWHKPQISAKAIPQGETDALVAEGEQQGVYHGKKFEIVVTRDADGIVTGVTVDGRPALFETGKTKDKPNKKFSIRETPAMFGARLLADIYERPAFYFVRKEIPRTMDDLRAFRREVYNIYQTIKAMRAGNWWFRNDQQDSMTSHGSWGKLCYFNVDVSDGHTPEGFKRIFGEEPA